MKELIKAHQDRVRQIEEMMSFEEKTFYDSAINKISNDPSRENAIACYWETKIDVQTLTEMFGYKHTRDYQEDMAGCYGVTLKCYICNADVVVYPRSRTQLSELNGKYGKQSIECPECIAKRETRFEKAEETRKKKEDLKIHELKTMPYAEYLTTNHWKGVSRKARDKANNKCQKCGRDNITLHVHHLTYERRGEELPKDLIAVCEVCHALLHERITQKEADIKFYNADTPLRDKLSKMVGGRFIEPAKDKSDKKRTVKRSKVKAV